MKERNSAHDHYLNSNYGFERNEKQYNEQLKNKMKKQEAIRNLALSGGLRLPTYSMEQKLKEDHHNAWVNKNIIQKQAADDYLMKMR